MLVDTFLSPAIPLQKTPPQSAGGAVFFCPPCPEDLDVALGMLRNDAWICDKDRISAAVRPSVIIRQFLGSNASAEYSGHADELSQFPKIQRQKRRDS
jgi:hypothetical protein